MNDRRPTSQEVIVNENTKKLELRDKVSAKDGPVALCDRYDSEAVVAQALRAYILKIVESASTDALGAEVYYTILLEVPPTDVSLFPKPTCEVHISIGVRRLDLYSATRWLTQVQFQMFLTKLV